MEIRLELDDTEAMSPAETIFALKTENQQLRSLIRATHAHQNGLRPCFCWACVPPEHSDPHGPRHQ